MPADKLDISVAEPDKLFYVVANLIPIRKDDGRALILKRGENESSYPGKWATIGGNMMHSEFDIKIPSQKIDSSLVYESPLFSLLKRKAQQEAGIKIDEPLVFIDNKLVVHSDGVPINLMTFTARYAEGEIALQIGDFTEFAWVNGEEIEQYDCIEGVKQEVKKALSIFDYATYIEAKKDD